MRNQPVDVQLHAGAIGQALADGLQVADAFGNLDDLTFARLYRLLRVLYCEKLVLAEPLVCKAVAFRRLR